MGRIINLNPVSSLSSGSYVAVDTREETYRFDLGAALKAGSEMADYYDEATGRYVDLGKYLDTLRDGRVYGVKIPKYAYSTATACIKTGANSGLSITPATATDPGSDDYAELPPFRGWDVNGGADADGSPFVTAVRSEDDAFSLTGANGNVWRMALTLYWRLRDMDDYIHLEICDKWLDGFEPQPGAKLPDGTIRPFMLYAKYAGGTYNGSYASVSGVQLRNRNVSHNSLVTLCANATTGYSGKSIADDWYVKVMFLLKYATKNSQSVFTGCTGYTTQCAPTVAESGVRRIIVSTANAAALLVGSSVMLGNQATANTDRNNANCYNVFDAATITRIEEYDSSNSAVYVDTASTFDTETTYLLSTAPWSCGCLDSVQGTDGTITAAGRTNSKEPFLLQGIECMLGAYEVLGDVMLYSGESVVDVYVNYDSRDEKTAYDPSVYVDAGVALTKGTATGWQYGTDIASAGGLLVQQGSGASTSTGVCDGHYAEAPTSSGWREFLGLGTLNHWGLAGLWCDDSNRGLSLAHWYFASRLSATGRTVA